MPRDPEINIVQVPTYVERQLDGVWDCLVVCPHCGDRHQHGGGTGRTPGLGHRLSHCIRGDQRDDYLLVPGSDDMSRPVAQRRGWRNQQWRNALAGKPAIGPEEACRSGDELEGTVARHNTGVVV